MTRQPEDTELTFEQYDGSIEGDSYAPPFPIKFKNSMLLNETCLTNSNELASLLMKLSSRKESMSHITNYVIADRCYRPPVAVNEIRHSHSLKISNKPSLSPLVTLASNKIVYENSQVINPQRSIVSVITMPGAESSSGYSSALSCSGNYNDSAREESRVVNNGIDELNSAINYSEIKLNKQSFFKSGACSFSIRHSFRKHLFPLYTSVKKSTAGLLKRRFSCVKFNLESVEKKTQCDRIVSCTDRSLHLYDNDSSNDFKELSPNYILYNGSRYHHNRHRFCNWGGHLPLYDIVDYKTEPQRETVVQQVNAVSTKSTETSLSDIMCDLEVSSYFYPHELLESNVTLCTTNINPESDEFEDSGVNTSFNSVHGGSNSNNNLVFNK
ncbi:hypothetical protein GJ496_006329 [Pomphorhynchus laevis]|nr:hypothetical protein GJ496_006329 [Pomphorhynchus laevis]